MRTILVIGHDCFENLAENSLKNIIITLLFEIIFGVSYQFNESIDQSPRMWFLNNQSFSENSKILKKIKNKF